MPSDAFVKAASETSRTPVLLMAVESVDAITRASQTKSDWAAAIAAHQVDLDYNTNYVVPQVVPWGTSTGNKITVPYDMKVRKLRGQVRVYAERYTYTREQRFTLFLPDSGYQWKPEDTVTRFTTITDFIPENYRGIDTVYTPPTAVGADTGWVTFDVVFDFPNEPYYKAGETIDLTCLCWDTFVGPDENRPWVRLDPYLDAWDPTPPNYIVEWAAEPTLEIRAKDSYIETKVLDLGLTPSQASTLSVGYEAPQGSAMTFSAKGSNNASVLTTPTDATLWTSLGSVVDGASLPPYRFYAVRADLSSGWQMPRLSEIRIDGGDSQFRYYSTRRDEPVPGALPYLKKVSSLTSKIELMKAPTTGEVTVVLDWTQDTSDLLQTGYLKNKNVLIKMGFEGLPLSDYEPIFTGFWYDYSVSSRRREVTVKLRDILKRFAKRKIPQEVVDNTTNQIGTTPLEYSGWNVFEVFLDIFNQMTISDRYIDRAAFEALRDTHTGAQWTVSRRLGGMDEKGEYRPPVKADKILEELMAVSGVFLVPMPDGRLKPVLYDADAAPEATLDALWCDFEDIAGGQGELYTRQYIYYAPYDEEEAGDRPEDYQKAYLHYDATAETAWEESSEKYFYDRWNASEAAIVALAERMSDWYANPHHTVGVSVPPRYAGVVPGQVVAVDDLRVPAEKASWPGLTAGRKYLVLTRRLEPRTGKLTFELFDLGGGSKGAGVWANSIEISGPAQPYGATNVYTAAGGDGTYAWRVSKGVLSASTGASVTLDVTGQTGPLSLSVTSGNLTKVISLQVLPPQLSGLAHEHTDTGTVLSWTPQDPEWIKEYEIRKGESWEAGVFVARLRHTEFNLGFLPVGAHSYCVRGLDAWDNYSGADAATSFSVQAPSMLSVTPQVIDNNVNLYLIGVPGSYPIATFRCFRGDQWATAEFKAEGTFFAIFERQSGNYTYWIEPRDLAGNYGAPLSATAAVSEPPDYVLFSDQDLDLSAVAVSNLAREGLSLVGPFDTSQSWETHFTANAWSAPKNQIDAGYPYYLQPSAATGYLEEVVDLGAQIPATLVTCTPTWTTIDGTVTLTPRLQVSADGSSYTDLGEVWSARGENFRYVKIRITLTAADATSLAQITRVNLKLDVKEKNDAGVFTASAADANGTPVSFNKAFVDVISVTANANHQSGTDGIIAEVDFEDVPNPTTFTVYLFRRSDGARLSGSGTWSARGV